MSAEVRFYDDEDLRREAAVEMMKRHVRADRRITCDYDADIEWLEHALVAFADEWAASCYAANAQAAASEREMKP